MSDSVDLSRNEARCGECGGQILEWHSAPGRWFHDTVSAADDPFDIIDWFAHPEKEHRGYPAACS